MQHASVVYRPINQAEKAFSITMRLVSLSGGCCGVVGAYCEERRFRANGVVNKCRQQCFRSKLSALEIEMATVSVLGLMHGLFSSANGSYCGFL